MNKKNSSHYGTFVTKTPWYFNRKHAAIAAISVAVLVLSLALGFKLSKHDDKQQTVFETPKAEAFEIPGWWYKDYFGSSVCASDNCKPDADPDEDKLSNAQEFFYHSNPLESDTNKNGLTDGADVAQNYDPSRPGKITFEEVMSDENILGESLVFDQDIKNMVAESQDISKVNLSLTDNSELKVIYATDAQSYKTYAKDLQDKIHKYFPQGDIYDITQILGSATGSDLEAVKNKSRYLSEDLKGITIPYKFLTFHKYNIAFYQLLAEVVPGPSVDYANNFLTPENDLWYDKAQAFLAIQQKLSFETEILKRELGS